MSEEKKLDVGKQKIIEDFLKKKDNPDFKGFRIQSGPGTGKTFLLETVIKELSKNLKNENILVLSFGNSAIDTIATKLKLKNNTIEIKTIASFFIENFIIPFSYSILHNEDLREIKYTKNGKATIIPENTVKFFLNKISNNFSENNITTEWNILNGIIEKYGKEDKYFNLFYNIIIQKKIKYIFVDEYQDTQNYYFDIFNKIIAKGEIKFFCVGDKNQQINYEEDNNAFDGLDNSHSLNTTYRYGQNILDYTNKILVSGIIKPDKKCNIGSINNLSKGYTPIKGKDDERIKNLITFTISIIEEKESIFKGKNKNNVILFQPATDYSFGKDFNNLLKNTLLSNNKIIFSHTEKPIYNIHLKLFIEKVIAFVNGIENINFTEIEKELDFFYERGVKKSNFKRIFFEILKLKTTDTIKAVGVLLQSDGFKAGGKHKEYFKEIVELLNKGNITFKDAKNKQLIEIINLKEDDKIYITTNTITSAKGKQYDNVIILNIYNGESFSNVLKNNINIKKQNEAKRHYYVAVSRAKENVFTFVDYEA